MTVLNGLIYLSPTLSCDARHAMRIDSASLIAAQSATRAHAPQPVPSGGKPVFEPLNFPRTAPDPAPMMRIEAPPRPILGDLGSKLDITV